MKYEIEHHQTTGYWLKATHNGGSHATFKLGRNQVKALAEAEALGWKPT